MNVFYGRSNAVKERVGVLEVKLIDIIELKKMGKILKIFIYIEIYIYICIL